MKAMARTLSLLQTTKKTSQILQIHAQLITTNTISDPFHVSKLLDSATSNFPNMVYAELIFLQIYQPNTFMYNTMIKAYTSNSNPQKAFKIYVEMRRNDILFDDYTHPFVLRACSTMLGLSEGRQVHGEVVKRGFYGNVFVKNGLIGMYCRCGEIACSRGLFDGFNERDLVSWSLMLGGYVGIGDMMEAQKLFDEMPDRSVVSWSIMINGYGKKMGDLARARFLFDIMPERDLISWNTMIDLYSKVGDMVSARELFGMMEHKNVISWSIMIDGYACHGDPEEALSLFNLMLCKGLKPDKISVVGAISACAQLGALDQGRWIDVYIKKNKIMSDVVVQTALVDMYMKCGSIEEALALFRIMSKRNVITWNAVISGLGINGFGEKALTFFAHMAKEGIQMDDLIFLSVLSACSHAGFIGKGLDLFHQMRHHGIEPKLEHYGCLIDLLGRAGELEKALMTIKSMPMEPNSELWGSLLLSCRIWKNIVIAEFVVERLAELKADNGGVYVLMSNIYASVGMWEGVKRIRDLMRERNMNKERGKSVIEVDGGIEEFVSGRIARKHVGEIESMLQSLVKTAESAE